MLLLPAERNGALWLRVPSSENSTAPFTLESLELAIASGPFHFGAAVREGVGESWALSGLSDTAVCYLT